MEVGRGVFFSFVGETHFDFDFVVDVFVCHLFFSLFSFLFPGERGVRGRGVCGCDGVWSVGGREVGGRTWRYLAPNSAATRPQSTWRGDYILYQYLHQYSSWTLRMSASNRSLTVMLSRKWNYGFTNERLSARSGTQSAGCPHLSWSTGCHRWKKNPPLRLSTCCPISSIFSY